METRSTASRLRRAGLAAAAAGALGLALWLVPGAGGGESGAVPAGWEAAWPETDFSRRSVPLDEIMSGGPPKDGIPSIDDPRFVALDKTGEMKGTEPVISLEIGGDARAYPLAILMYHEIVNDRVGGTPVAVTFCPLCNAAVVFDRRVDGRVLEFGTTGKLRHSDLVMYDRQTESWWQQFLGEAIVGELTGTRLEMLPARVESIARFRERHPDGRVLVPNSPARDYGLNPYAGYDTRDRPPLYDGPLPEGIAPLARVVTIGDEAWSLDLLRRRGRIEAGDYVLTWTPGQNSALGAAMISAGRDVGNVVVQKRTPEGLVDAVYGVDFAFAFHAFHPEGVIHTE